MSVPSKVRNCAEPPEHLSSEISLAHLQHSKFDILCTSHSPVETFHWLCAYNLHGCEIACALKQTFAQCKMFVQGTLHCR